MKNKMTDAIAIRSLAITLLDDEDGISSDAWDILNGILFDIGGCGDILQSVKTTQGKFYLPENWVNYG